MLILCVLSLTKFPQLDREIVKVRHINKYEMIVTSSQPIEQLFIDDMYENTDYFLEMNPENNKARVRMLTERGPLKLLITTNPKKTGLIRKYVVTCENPSKIFKE